MLSRNKNYAQIVSLLQQERLKKKPVNLPALFSSVMQKLDRGDAGHAQLQKCWTLLSLLLTSSPTSSSQQQQQSLQHQQSLFMPQEQSFAKMYGAVEEGNEAEARSFSVRLCKASKRFLEESYWTYVQTVVSQHRIEVSGMPTPDR
jgi:hypothetical protein